MKRLFTALIFMIFLPFSFFSETIDGSVVVGGKDDFPEGLFVKARGYLPGDIITLTNSYDGESVQLLNIGTLDNSDGVSMVLSRESAQKLGITPGTRTPISYETRSGSFDQRASGSAYITRAVSSKKEAAPVELYGEENPEDVYYETFEDSRNAVEAPSPLDEKPFVQNTDYQDKRPVEEETVSAPEKTEEPEDLRTYERVDESEILKEPEVSEDPLPSDDIPEVPPAAVKEPPFKEPEINEVSDEKAEPAVEEVKEAEPEVPEYERFNPDELPVIEEEKHAPVQAEVYEKFTPDELSAVEEVKEEKKPEETVPAEIELPPQNDLEGENVIPAEPVAIEEEFVADDLPEENVENVTPEETAVPEEPETPSEEVLPPENSLPPENDLEGEEVISVEPAVPVQDDAVAEDLPGELVTDEEPVYEVPSDDEPSEDEPVADFTYLPAENDGVPASDLEGEEVSSKEPERIPCADLTGEEVLSIEPKPVPLPDSEGEAVDNKEPVQDNAYEGIVLVPAEPLPPVNEPEPEPVEVEEVPFEPEPVPEDLPGEKVKEEAPAEKAVEDKVVDQAEEKTEDLLSKYITEESALKKGAFYIQVASFSKKENAEALIKKYPRYPYAVIITKTGSYKILAGPLNEDEYGAVFERFKSYGFKDAFVKKIKKEN